MLITQLLKFLTAPISEKNKSNYFKSPVVFWFSLSLCFALVYIIPGIQQAFSHEYVIGDNAREYISWMYRYTNPRLFPHDLIANYFQSVTPIGYGGFYQIMMSLGIDPIFLSKILPIPIILITTSYCFVVCMQILPVPVTGFIATLLLNQALGLHDDLFSACPRDFIYPLFLGFLYYLLRGSLSGVLVTLTLQALFYPLIAFVDLGILLVRLWIWKNGQLRFSPQKQDILFGVTGLSVALIAIIPYAFRSSEFGPAITASMSKLLPDYFSGGRVSYYHVNPVSFWLDGRDSGVLALMSPVQIFIGLLLPIFLIYKSHFPLGNQITNQVKILWQVMTASVGMFFVAHALSFKLHFPSRYTHHTFKMILAIATGIVLTLILDKAVHWSQDSTHQQKRQILTFITTVVVGAALILYPYTLKTFPKTPYVVGGVPSLYKFLEQQPPDSLTASLANEADNIPAYTKRSILVGKEYALPFHPQYYAKFSERMIDLINAQYSEDIHQVVNFINKYNIKFWLVDVSAFQPEYIGKNSWIKQYQPAATMALSKRSLSSKLILPQLMKSCNVLETENLVLLKTECMKK